MVNNDSKILRNSAITQLDIIWPSSKDRIINLINKISKKEVLDTDKKLFESLQVLDTIIFQITTENVQYKSVEDPDTFKQKIDSLQDVFNRLFCTFFHKNELDIPIDKLCKLFFEEIDIIKKSPEKQVTLQGYPPITQVIRFIRNLQKHNVRPLDHITGKHTYGNVYTLVSILILSIYGYIEILENWLEVI